MPCKFRWAREDGKTPEREDFRSERMYKHRHTFDRTKPVYYGGGFWERVELLPVLEPHIQLSEN
jgi:hypothetical protein